MIMESVNVIFLTIISVEQVQPASLERGETERNREEELAVGMILSCNNFMVSFHIETLKTS